MSDDKHQIGLQPHLSPMAAWALSVGTAVGWGSLVVTSNTYLNSAGPLGTIIGLVAGAVLMLLMCRNFFFMASHYPRAGGIYTYTKEVFGYDRAFLVFWFLSLAYFSMFWANATSLPLFARFFIGDVLKFGHLFDLFGYGVYAGEVLLTITAVIVITFLGTRFRCLAMYAMPAMVWIFTGGITFCFGAALLGYDGSLSSMSPGFVPDSSALSQAMHIAFISPWAFIGFESITHSAEEFSFKKDKLYQILVASVLTSTALYIFVTLLSITAYPEDCSGWLDYIQNLNRYSGIEGLPAFYAAHHYLGDFGVAVLMAALLSLVLTSLICNLRSLSRLFYAVARDDILPGSFARLNDKQLPANAMILVAALSIPVAFVGRTAIGWIVDVTTLGATMLYGFVSAAAFKKVRMLKSRREMVTGAIGFVIMLAFGTYLMFPHLFGDFHLETETYLLLMVWTVLGFFYFRWVIKNDKSRRFGKAIIVWIALLALVIFVAIIWSKRVDEQSTNESVRVIQEYYHGAAEPAVQSLDEETFIQAQLDHIHHIDATNTLIITILFVLDLLALLINHMSMEKWERKAVAERDQAKETALKDPLTGAKSKHAFLQKEREINTAITEGRAENFAVVVCDVNGLKMINDTKGHKAGDEYIRQSFMIICDIFQHSPVYRIGGDEFVVIMTGRDYAIRQALLQTLHDSSVENIAKGGAVISGGVSDYIPGKDPSFHNVFGRADNLMYEEKKLLRKLGAVTREDAERAAEAGVPAANVRTNRGSAAERTPNSKRHILVVKDRNVNLMMLDNILQEQEYDVLYAKDGADAMDLVRHHREDIAIVLLDLENLKMLHLNGEHGMKALHDTREIPETD